MAKSEELYMYGLEIKALEKFKGHDGEHLLRGNLYFNNKKVGRVAQDWSMGETFAWYDRHSPYKDQALQAIDKLGYKLWRGYTRSVMNFFVLDFLLESKEAVQDAKRKKATIVVVHLKGHQVQGFVINQATSFITDTFLKQVGITKEEVDTIFLYTYYQGAVNIFRQTQV